MTPEDIKNIAHLARIEISDEEVTSFKNEMESVLGYVDQINQFDAPEINVQFDQVNSVRPDTVVNFDGTELLDQAPDKQDGFYKVPKIL
jgi:aspartyl-tRNA(Asn)/glutamyl-tRNA(Gln) amidotransferase subunit C